MSTKPRHQIADLADYVASAWLRGERALDPPQELRPLLGWKSPADQRRYRGNHARLLREAVKERDWMRSCDGLAPYGPQHFRFLERAFPHMSKRERAFYLEYVWVRAKMQPSKALRLRLLSQASELRKSVPKSWPTRVQLYRGSQTSSWRTACRNVRTGISWTLKRDVAMKFADPGIRLEGITQIGCIGAVTVPRRQILAYLINYYDYNEHECIVDPSTLAAISYERIEVDSQVDSGSHASG